MPCVGRNDGAAGPWDLQILAAEKSQPHHHGTRASYAQGPSFKSRTRRLAALHGALKLHRSGALTSRYDALWHESDALWLLADALWPIASLADSALWPMEAR